MAILSWIATRFGLSALKSLLNPIILALLLGGVVLGGAVGWTKAAQHYSDASQVAQLESQLAQKQQDYTALVQASAASSAQLAAATVKQVKQDAVIADYDTRLNADRAEAAKLAATTGKAPVCNDTVSAELLAKMKANQ